MDSAAIAWLVGHSLADGSQRARLSAIGCGELAARVVEREADQHVAQIGADLLIWLFAFDDAYCDESRFGHRPDRMALLVAKLMRVVETGVWCESDGPFAAALRDICLRLAQVTTPVQLARVRAEMRAYFGFQVWESAYRSCGDVPGVTDYLRARISSGAMPVCAMLLDVSGGFVVPADEMESRPVKALTEMCCLTVGLDNDLISYDVETARSGDRINIVDILAAERQWPVSDAVTEAVGLRDRVLARFLRLADDVRPTLSEPGQRYLRLLAAWIRGNLDWAVRSRRYVGDPAAGTTAIADHPVTTDPHQALTYPSVSWWWSVTAG